MGARATGESRVQPGSRKNFNDGDVHARCLTGMRSGLRTVGILVVVLGAVVTVLGISTYACMVGTPSVPTQCTINVGVLGFGILALVIGAVLIFSSRIRPVPKPE